ncbi:hypothetical protein [Streptomyces sp. NPDC004783]|uniref:hypothetical protein n=1 Tax=Streptomyces sp. NPDC004783 TaxID=3154459 RepID=UPI0033BC2158
MTNPTTTDQTPLRETLARAIYASDWPNGRWEMRPAADHERYLANADAVLAVLPAPADRASLRDRIAEAALSAVEAAMDDTLLPAEREKALSGIAAVLPAPADRAAVLREAAAALRAQAKHVTGEFSDSDVLHEDGPAATVATWKRAADLLRRMADESPTAEHRPPRHRWAAEFRDPVADEWIPSTRYLNRHHAVERYEAAVAHAPKWKDGTPVERRLVRETTTYTVEAEHQPAAGARQEGVQQ